MSKILMQEVKENRKPQEISEYSLAVDYAVTNQGQQLQ